jgi:predicted dehydrogenase
MTRLALVGCGGHANSHAQAFSKIPEAEIVALVDTAVSRAEAFKAKYFPNAAVYDDFAKLLAAPPAGLEGVVIVTPHTTHYAQVKAALEAGLHVLVEKPMVTRSDHAYDLWRTSLSAGRHLAIAYQAPYSAEYQCLKALRDGGRLGKVQIIQGWLAQGWLKATPNTWRQDPALSGGGQMYDSGAHVLNAMMWLMNEPVTEVACLYDACGSPVDINGVAIMRFRGGALGSVAIGGNSPGWHARVVLQTDRLQAVTGPHGGELTFSSAPELRYPHVPTSDRPAAFTPQRNFVDVLRGEAEPQSPVRYGVLLSALMDALYESAAKGAPVQVRPVPDVL